MSEILCIFIHKKGPLFSNSVRQTKKKCIHKFVLMGTKFQIEDAINMLECIHVSLCTDDLTGFNHSLSVNPVLHVLVCVDVCVCVCVCV